MEHFASIVFKSFIKIEQVAFAIKVKIISKLELKFKDSFSRDMSKILKAHTDLEICKLRTIRIKGNKTFAKKLKKSLTKLVRVTIASVLCVSDCLPI